MSRIAPLALADIDDPELRELIARCEALGVPDGLFPRILARVPSHAKPLLRALLLSHTEGNVDHKLKEIIRIQLARFAGDGYFAALRSAKAREAGLTEAEIEAGCGDYEDAACFTEAEKCALRYADQMYLDASKVDVLSSASRISASVVAPTPAPACRGSSPSICRVHQAKYSPSGSDNLGGMTARIALDF